MIVDAQVARCVGAHTFETRLRRSRHRGDQELLSNLVYEQSAA
ncbi:MAG: hypothetical protein VB137_10755 [Burkholderia sp.]